MTQDNEQSDAAEVRILIENLYKFKSFAELKVICTYSAEGWNFNSINKLLKKLRDSGQLQDEQKAADVAVCILISR